MSRLIDADSDKLEELIYDNTYSPEYHRIMRGIQNLPTVDAVEVVHGVWFEVSARELFGSDSDQLAGYVCSKCGFDIGECNADAFNYCPNCGAKMDGLERCK